MKFRSWAPVEQREHVAVSRYIYILYTEANKQIWSAPSSEIQICLSSGLWYVNRKLAAN